MNITYRQAEPADLPAIVNFTDHYLSAHAPDKSLRPPHTDAFITRRQHADKIKYATVLLAFDNQTLVAWAIKGKNGSLFNILTHPNYRHHGIATAMIKRLHPAIIRSKTDQSTGDPTPFYESLGYHVTATAQGKQHNITLLVPSPKSRGSPP
jgi:GNAT superfamily N-acetyltransferase